MVIFTGERQVLSGQESLWSSLILFCGTPFQPLLSGLAASYSKKQKCDQIPSVRQSPGFLPTKTGASESLPTPLSLS